MKEHHPYMFCFTIGALGVGVFGFPYFINLMLSPNFGFGNILGILLILLSLVGPIWLIIKSDSLNKWSTLSNNQKFLSYLIMTIGVLVGIVVIVIIAVVKQDYFTRK